jgi:hypothetical protein
VLLTVPSTLPSSTAETPAPPNTLAAAESALVAPETRSIAEFAAEEIAFLAARS